MRSVSVQTTPYRLCGASRINPISGLEAEQTSTMTRKVALAGLLDY